jgi:hypothetical protein
VADYVTPQQIADFAQEFDQLEPDAQDRLATAASRLFDKLCGVSDDFFNVAGVGYTDRVYIGDGTAYLKVDPYVALNPTDPVAIEDGFEVPEYREQNGYLIVKTSRGFGVDSFGHPYYRTWRFDGLVEWPRDKEITVSARWGFAAIPADVQMAVMQIAIHLWRTADPAFQQISESGNAFSGPALPDQAMEIITRNRTKYGRTAVFA